MGEARIVLEDLRVEAPGRVLVDQVGLELRSGEILALVGPSGAGKTLTSRSLLGLVDFHPGVVSAKLCFELDGHRIQPWDRLRGGSSAALGPRIRRWLLGRGNRSERDRAFRDIRGSVVGLLAQDARGALDPLMRVGDQVARCLPEGSSVGVRDCLIRAGLEEPDRVAGLWPHELSGGMARRVTIAQVLARQSRFAIVDEPTTGLDAVGVHDLARELRKLADEAGIGLLLITHDLRILPGLADRLLVMDQGQIVERLSTADLARAQSATGKRLVAATRRIAGRRLT